MTTESTDYLFWFTIVLHIISFCIVVLVLLFYLTHYCCHTKSTSNIRFIIKLLTVIGSMACISCAIFNGLTVYIDKDKHTFNDIWYQGENISHCIINIMTYSIYIYRLHLSFYDTCFKISKCMIIILISLVSLDVLNFMVEFWVYQSNVAWFKLLYIDIIGLFTESMITILCLWLFNINLFRLMLRMKTSILSVSQISASLMSQNEVEINNNENGNNLNDRQQLLIHRIVRNALLCSLTIMFWIFERISWLLFVYNESDKYYHGLLIAKCMTGIALMIDACCMLFTFRFATKLYQRFCIYCDRFCENICKYCAKKYEKHLENNIYVQ